MLLGLQDSGQETPATRAANPHRGAEHVRNTVAAASARGGFMGKVFAVRPCLLLTMPAIVCGEAMPAADPPFRSTRSERAGGVLAARQACWEVAPLRLACGVKSAEGRSESTWQPGTCAWRLLCLPTGSLVAALPLLPALQPIR